MMRTPVRAVRVALEDTVMFTTFPARIGATQKLVFTIVQSQLGGPFTVTLSVPPSGGNEAVDLDRVRSHTTTVRVAFVLVAEPKALLTEMKYWPASADPTFE